ncbi:hypothetical protein [Actinomadura sp. 7K507]|uniref:hypothetical protein n=1 Tax=Actinomadura sp. 7K507 TaxID=2530365 RepID=UPI0010511327|nr:hypothetical protein [Actinomadura sp. 7K507]TDC87991.1 hypothetical protein E1285_19055 [Actinomadura sp. 7K507]
MSRASAQATGAAVGFLVGGAAGFFLTETVGAFFHFILDRTLDVDGTGGLLAAFIAVPVLCAVLGAVVGARRANRQGG